MGSHNTELDDQSTVDGTPEDVAALYAWANLRGAKYRDYSASRREYRAQVRYRAAKALLERELEGQVKAEAAAAQAERLALESRTEPDSQSGEEPQASRIALQRAGEDATRKASLKRVEAARKTEAAARAGVLALREEREIAEAHSSALRQAVVYKESELRRRKLAGPQPYGRLADSYAPPPLGQSDLRGGGPANLQQFLHPDWQRSTGYQIPDLSAPNTPMLEGVPRQSDTVRALMAPAVDDSFGIMSESCNEEQTSTPAWLHSSQPTARRHSTQATTQFSIGALGGGETLQDSRERVAARWFALKDVFERTRPELPSRQPLRARDGEAPLLAVFSVAGGVGKTSLVATLGRALASLGENVVLADTTSQGLLGIYFGSQNARSSAEEVILSQTTDPPISLAIHDFADRAEDDQQRDILTEEILGNGQGHQRLLLDLSTGSSWLIRRLVDFHPTVLVPIAPDMNSVISLHAVERMFRGLIDSEGRPLLPYYVLNQFDASLPLHLDVREVFRRQLGDRLLQLAIRRSQAVSEALADGMTVLDYAPGAMVSQDYRDIALWLKGVSPLATEESPRLRWGKR